MTDPRHRLIQAATDLRRKVYNSLPWGFRVAHILRQVKFATEPSVFGQSIYGLFLLYGVENMPTPPAIPTSTRDFGKLKGYGREFGAKAFHYALKIFSRDRFKDEKAQEVLSNTVLKLLSDSSLESKLAGKPLLYAENYVYKTIHSVAIDFMRRDRGTHENIEELIEEPASWDNLEDIIPQAELAQIINELERSVNLNNMPDIALYFQLLLEGHSTDEIAREKLLPSLQEKPMTQQGLRKYEAIIKNVLEKHFGVS